MNSRRTRQLTVAVIALAMPALTFFSFDGLMRQEAVSASVRAGIVVPPYASAPALGARLFAAGERLSRLKAEPDPPPPPPPAPKRLPEEVRIPVLVYHNVRPRPKQRLPKDEAQYDMTPAQFEVQLSFLRDAGYVATSLDHAFRALTEGVPLPVKPVVITLDDGRENQYEYAAPLLRKYGFSATYFVFTNAIDREGYFTTAQIRELAADGNEFCGHSRYHRYLTKSDDEELREEVAGSKVALESALAAPVRCFGYPFGLTDERVVQAVRDAGYVLARGLRHGVTHRREDLFDMKAHIITGNLDQLKAVLGQ